MLFVSVCSLIITVSKSVLVPSYKSVRITGLYDRWTKMALINNSEKYLITTLQVYELQNNNKSFPVCKAEHGELDKDGHEIAY